MSSSQARKGRLRQRYEDQLRLVAGCIPYKLEKKIGRNHSMETTKVLVLMISTPNRDDLVFPKGGWEDDETVSEAACREAMEEAGVKGVLAETPLGVWEFRSKSKEKMCSTKEGGCRGYMFALQVMEELDSWPEQANYKRIWLSAEEAFKFCRYDWMVDALQKFLTTLNKECASDLELTPKQQRQGCSSASCSAKPSASGVHQLDESCCGNGTNVIVLYRVAQPSSVGSCN